jgi:Protein of unknown function (DUF4231)
MSADLITSDHAPLRSTDAAPSQTPADAVRSRLEEQLRWHDDKAVRCQRAYVGLKFIQLTAAATVPVAAALSAGEAVTAALGAVILVIEGMQQVGQYHHTWITTRATCEALEREKHLHLAHAGSYARAGSPDRLLAERVEAIVAGQVSGWTATQEQVRSEEGRTHPE